MKIRDVMSTPVVTCRATAVLGDAAETMQKHLCGSVVVVDSRGRPAGMVTDRDVCLAVAARHQSPWRIPVRDVMSPNVVSCLVNDDLDVALVAMKQHGVRRLPIVDGKGQLRGLLSIDDVILRTGGGRTSVPADAVADVLRHICSPDAAAVVGER